ncbi:uncharacterized protein LOC144916527 [Branchiostoma floridae x Branchiostoma belcheri]
MLKNQGQHGIPDRGGKGEPRVFVIHAGEDKDSFVRPLVSSLQEGGLQEKDIFFDEVAIKPGDIIRDRIMSTLSSESLELAVIVVSASFLNKSYWPRLEYETCLKNNKHIFPIWVDANEDNFKAFSESVGKYSPTLKQMSGRCVQIREVANELPNIAAEIVQRLSALRQGHHDTQPAAIQMLLYAGPPSSSSDSSDLEQVTGRVEENVCGAGNIEEQSVEKTLKNEKAKELELIENIGRSQLRLLKEAEGLLTVETIAERTGKLLDDLYQKSLRVLEVKKGCAIVHLVPNNLSTLERFWRDCKSGRLSRQFTDRLVSDEMRAAAGQNLAMRVVILERQYRQWTGYFNTRDTMQTGQQLPSSTMTSATLHEQPSVSPTISKSTKTKWSYNEPRVVYIKRHTDLSDKQAKEKRVGALREEVEREHRKAEKVEKRRQLLEQEEQKKHKHKEHLKKLQQQALSEREKLLTYRFGDKHGSRFFAGTDVSDIQQSDHSLRIGVFGPPGSGKGSFINTCERALRLTTEGTRTTVTNQPEGTILVQEYLGDIGGKFCLVDTRGFSNFNEKEFTAMTNIVYGRIWPGEEMDLRSATEVDRDDSRDTFLHWLHAVVFVMSAQDPLLINGTHATNLKRIRYFMRPRGIAPVTVVTHADQVRDKSQLGQIKTKASAATGSAKVHVYFIENYTHHPERDFNTELRAMKILNAALMVGERYVKIHKQQQQYATEARQTAAAEVFATETHLTIEEFFRRLCDYRHIPYDRLEPLITHLTEEDVTTAGLLRDTWDDLEAELPISSRLKLYIKEALFGDFFFTT